jgi:hypothetical protein
VKHEVVTVEEDYYVEENRNVTDAAITTDHADIMVEAHTVPDDERENVVTVEATPVRLTSSHKIAFYGLFGVVVVVIVLVSVLTTRGKSNPPNPTSLTVQDLQERLINYTQINMTSANNDGSPQVRALTWLASEGLDAATPLSTILNGFVMAAFYYATNGPGWSNSYAFLSGTDVCSWNDGASSSPHGVQCNTLNEVTSLRMSETNNEEKKTKRINRSSAQFSVLLLFLHFFLFFKKSTTTLTVY